MTSLPASGLIHDVELWVHDVDLTGSRLGYPPASGSPGVSMIRQRPTCW